MFYLSKLLGKKADALIECLHGRTLISRFLKMLAVGAIGVLILLFTLALFGLSAVALKWKDRQP